MTETTVERQAREIAEEIVLSHGEWPVEQQSLRLQGELTLARAYLDALDRLEKAEAALNEVHEFQCGCDEPGNTALCVAQPTATFSALATPAPDKEDTE